MPTKYSGTTVINGSMSSKSSSSQNSRDASRDGTPDRLGDRLSSATGKRRVPVEQSASGFIEQRIRVNRQAVTVVVENHKSRTK